MSANVKSSESVVPVAIWAATFIIAALLAAGTGEKHKRAANHQLSGQAVATSAD